MIFESCREQNWENLINSVVRSFAAANCDVRQPISEDDPGGQWQRIYIAGHGSVGIPARCDPRLLPPWQTHRQRVHRSEEHTSELQSLMRISYAVLCLKKKQTFPNVPRLT